MMQHNFFDPMGHESIQAICKKQQKTLEDPLLLVREPREEETDMSDCFKCTLITIIIKFHVLL